MGMLPLTRSKWEVAKVLQVQTIFLEAIYSLSDFPRTISGTPRADKASTLSLLMEKS